MTISVLDLAPIGTHETARDALEASVRLAQRAEELGYERVWYAEHHNFASIASSATAVVIAHVAAHTQTIRLGAGGVMLPNHAPLVIAEQFGTLATLHPDRIDLGLGRAPGTNQATMRALRRDATSAESFPQDVVELQGYLSGDTKIPTVHAIPGRGTNVPLYILGSSLFGAQLAAALGLPYAFASHFSPGALQDAVRVYREQFQPSAQLERPDVIAAVNVLATESEQESRRQLEARRRMLVRALFTRPGHTFTDEEVEVVLRSPQGAHVDQMLTYTAAGTPDAVKAYLDEFRAHADADELMLAHQGDTAAARLRSLELTAGAVAVTSS
jgi:luciferase family oxidoreductase group 1